MAKTKATRSRKRRKPDPFSVVRGKVVERIEVSTMDDDCAIGILFKDRTYLGFDVEPFLRITPDFSDWKTHNYKKLKRCPPVQRITRPAERRVFSYYQIDKYGFTIRVLKPEKLVDFSCIFCEIKESNANSQ